MNFTKRQIQEFFERIDQLDLSRKPQFGKMNVNQMVCHCSDFFKMAQGIKKAEEYGAISPKKIMMLAQSGNTVPVPKGFGQLEGGGTLPTHLAHDKKLLKNHILEFSNLSPDFEFAIHPYFGKMTRERWVELARFHLNHHLNQFGV